MTQVFSLNASPDIDAASARRQLQHYLSSLSSFRGRALAGPLAMPPISQSLPASAEVRSKHAFLSTFGIVFEMKSPACLRSV